LDIHQATSLALSSHYIPIIYICCIDEYDRQFSSKGEGAMSAETRQIIKSVGQDNRILKKAVAILHGRAQE
jgi:hypothetical protein